MSFEKKEITFRKLVLSDLPLMHRWLNQPEVHQWYDKDKKNSLEEIAKRYTPKILGKKPTDCYLVLFQRKPVAYIQTYRVNDWPEFGDHIGYDDTTASVDLFIGDQSFMGKGFGNEMLRKFIDEVVFSNESTIQTCVIGPETDNLRAIRAYEKAGFVYSKTVQIPKEIHKTYIMELKRTKLQ